MNPDLAGALKFYQHAAEFVCSAGFEREVEWQRSVELCNREGRLRAGQCFSYSWTCGGEPWGSINVRTEPSAVVLSFCAHDQKSDEWKTIDQRVPVTWTACKSCRSTRRPLGHADTRNHALPQTHRQNCSCPTSARQRSSQNPHSARRTAVAQPTAISCLGAFLTPAVSAPE